MSLEGKVAAILNERVLVINIGPYAGVEEDMKFSIIDGEVSLKDPNTGKVLGNLNRKNCGSRSWKCTLNSP